MFQRRSQAPVVVILNGDEAEGLQHTLVRLSHGAEDFGHGVHRAGLRLKRDFHEIALPQRLGQTQQPSGHGDGLEFGFGSAAVLESYRSQDRIA